MPAYHTFRSIPSILTRAPSECTTTPECTFCIMQCSGRNRTVSPTSGLFPLLTVPSKAATMQIPISSGTGSPLEWDGIIKFPR